MALKLDYVFASLSFSYFVRGRVRNFIFYIFYDNLKNRFQCKIILGHAVLQLLFQSIFSLQLSLLLNSSIR